jgi:hypothetical protein
MLLFLSSLTFDLDGYIEVTASDRMTAGDTRRRVNRVATLDGGVAVNDFGFTHADRTLDVIWRPTSSAIERAIDRLVQVYDRLHVATRDGVFLAAPETYTPGAAESRLRLLVLEKVSA